MTIDTHITRTTKLLRTPRVRQVEGMFDLPPGDHSEHNNHHRLHLPDPWNIGVIVGPSGSGKTTFASAAFGPHLRNHWHWPRDKSILDAFPRAMGIKEITSLLSSVGFSSPPAWLRPFASLSNGEQFRVNIARALAERPALAVVDEFTSVVDRTVARIASAAIASAVRRRKQKFIAVTCHYDVLDWLQPDWVYQPHTGELARGSLRQRPKIPLDIHRVHRSAWQLFKPHHYLDGNLHHSAACFLGLVDNQPAAFTAVLFFPHPVSPSWREHRTVCLPDFQGVGIGNAISEFVASLYISGGQSFTSTTSHPAMIRHRINSTHWRLLRGPAMVKQTHQGLGNRRRSSLGRITAGFAYVGPSRILESRQFKLRVSS